MLLRARMMRRQNNPRRASSAVAFVVSARFVPSPASSPRAADDADGSIGGAGGAVGATATDVAAATAAAAAAKGSQLHFQAQCGAEHKLEQRVRAALQTVPCCVSHAAAPASLPQLWRGFLRRAFAMVYPITAPRFHRSVCVSRFHAQDFSNYPPVRVRHGSVARRDAGGFPRRGPGDLPTAFLVYGGLPCVVPGDARADRRVAGRNSAAAAEARGFGRSGGAGHSSRGSGDGGGSLELNTEPQPQQRRRTRENEFPARACPGVHRPRAGTGNDATPARMVSSTS